MSLIKNLYDYADAQIMNHVNAGVRVWNWTTGRTKSELASTLAWTSPALTVAGGISYEDPLLPINLAVYSGMAYIASKVWRLQEAREKSARDKQMIDPIAEEIKRKSEQLGLIAGTFGTLQTILPLYSLGDFILSTGCYVSRADSIPPRKDCIRRGLDRLVEAYQSRRQEDALPTPA